MAHKKKKMTEIVISKYERQVWDRKKELRKWLSDHPFKLSVTLTFRKDVSEQCAICQLERFIKKLSSRLYGSRAERGGKRIKVAAFKEFQSSGRIHWHLLLYDGYDDGKWRLSMIGGAKHVRECWEACSFSGHQIDVQDINRKNIRKTVRYFTKKVGSDLENFHSEWL